MIMGKREETMRRIFMAGFGTAALFASSAAHAQLHTIDTFNLANTAKTVTQGAQQISQLAQQIETMKQQLTTAEQTFGSLAHAPESALSQFDSQFNVPALRNILPQGVPTMGPILNGSNISAIGPLGQQYATQNRVYQPQSNDFAAKQMTTNANSIAGVQAIANELFFSASQHINVIQQLEGVLSNAPDEKAVGDVQARMATEQTYIQAQQVQMQAIQTWQGAQVRNVDEQKTEAQRQNIDDVLSQDAATAGGG